MGVIFPQKITTPLKIINLLGNKRPKAMRYAVGLSMTAEGDLDRLRDLAQRRAGVRR